MIRYLMKVWHFLMKHNNEIQLVCASLLLLELFLEIKIAQQLLFQGGVPDCWKFKHVCKSNNMTHTFLRS